MKKILIIDDDKRIRDIIKIQLHNEELEILEASNDSEVFPVLSTHDISVILCDVKLKQADGFSIVEFLKSSIYSKIPVIMLTGFIDRETSERAKSVGCVDFITKPVKRQKLIETIKKALI